MIMSAKNMDNHNRWRNRTVAFRVVKLKSEDDGIDYNYIDLLAIVQVIKSSSLDAGSKPKKTRRKKDTE